MNSIPRDKSPDSSLALLSEGYRFIPNRCERYGSDIFQTRLMLRSAVCTTGEDAARMFYHPGRFTRKAAMPPTTLRLLQDKGSVQLLNDEAHRHRKQMFMSMMTPENIARQGDLFAQQWRRRLDRWSHSDKIVLHHEVENILCRAVCQWSGVPLSDSEAEQRTAEFSAMIEGAGSVGPRSWAGLLRRTRTETWAKGIITDIRERKLDAPEESAAYIIANHRDPSGEPLKANAATVELLNVLRPTVAVARYITFAALALHQYPESRELLSANSSDQELEWFVQEVRRFYPFFPLIAGHVRQAFDWRDHHFAEGTWVLLDLYGTNHDARVWGDPEVFRPERFGQWNESPYNFVPQGAGEHHNGHRCPGEWITIDIIKRAVKLLVNEMQYDVPPQDLTVNLSRMPAIPKSRFVITNVRPSVR